MPGVQNHLAELLRTSHARSTRALMKAFIADVGAPAIPLILVLDDLHTINAAEMRAAIALLLEYLPPALHLVLLTRSDPGFSVARLRARGALCELRAADLRFSETEAGELLNTRLGRPLTTEQVRALEQRTEGWAAGLQLAVLAMGPHTDPATFIDRFTGSHRYIMDYLADEALHRLEPDLQSFLIQTSVLRRLIPELCDAIVEQIEQPAAALLARLEAENSFLVPLDDEGAAYRYNQLFAALLYRQLPLDRATAIQRRAARWSAAHHQIEDAIGYALAGADHELAAALLVDHGLRLLFQGRLRTLQNWLDALPATLLAAQPRLCTLAAWVQVNQGRPEAAEPHLQAAEQAAPNQPAIHAVTALIRSNIARTREDLGVARREAERARTLAPDHAMTQGVARFQLGSVALLEDDATRACALLSEARALSRQSANLNVTLLSGGQLGLAHLVLGEREQAETALRETLTEAAAQGTPHSPLLAFAQLGMGYLAFTRDDAEGAWAMTARALAACHETQELGGLRLGFLLLAQIERAAGRVAAADRAEGQARQTLPGRPFPALAAQLGRLAAPVQPSAPASPQPPGEPLSEREHAILRLIAAGCKNQEIADQLIISLNTVLYHTKNIYGKLGVNRRTGAVARARDLGLL
jgi:LuxR family maltose regulon positive regulatory protein